MKKTGRPTPMMGSARAERLNFPTAAIIQAVMVVPKLAPMMTAMDSDSVNKPALTKETTITVVAEDDCSMEVIPKPVTNPDNRFWVIVAMT